MARDENMIAALKRERAAYVAAGQDDRVAEVDEQLTHYGYEHPQTETPEGRKSTSAAKQTADSGPEAKQTTAGEGKSPETPKSRSGTEATKQTASRSRRS